MLNRRPLIWGLILGLSTHLLEWLPVLLHTMQQPQRDIWIFVGFSLVSVRLIAFFCLSRNVMTEADSWRQGHRFALGWLSVSIVLLSIGFALISNNEILSLLDPHSSMFTGLSYIFFWFIWVIEASIETLIAGIQTLIRARRDHCRTTNTFVN